MARNSNDREKEGKWGTSRTIFKHKSNHWQHRRDSNGSENGYGKRGRNGYGRRGWWTNNRSSYGGGHQCWQDRSAAKELPQLLPWDVLRHISQFACTSSTLFALRDACKSTRSFVNDSLKKKAQTGELVSLPQLCDAQNPFVQQYDRVDNRDKRTFLLREQYKILRTKLVSLLNTDYGRHINLGPVDVDSLSLCFICNKKTTKLLTTPLTPRLTKKSQKELASILEKFGNCTNVVYSPYLLNSELFVESIRFRIEAIRVLDLDVLEPSPKLRVNETIFAKLVNLESLTWYNGTMDAVACLPEKSKLHTLSLTCAVSSQMEMAALAQFSELRNFYFGFRIPDRPMPFDMEEISSAWRKVWCDAFIEEAGNRKFLLQKLPNVETLGFFNAPEKLLVQMCMDGRSVKKLQFGQLSIDRKRLCSVDSLMHMFHIWDSNLPGRTFDVETLTLNLHAMPGEPCHPAGFLFFDIVRIMPRLRSLELFISNQSIRSWILINAQTKMPLNELTHFSLHVDGLCLFDDLEFLLGRRLQSLSISMALIPFGDEVCEEFKKRSPVRSLVQFLKQLEDITYFPDLTDISIQITGVRCLELLASTISCHLQAVRSLALLCHPVDETPSQVLALFQKLVVACPRLTRLRVTPAVATILVCATGNAADLTELETPRWRSVLKQLGSDVGAGRCVFEVGRMPDNVSFRKLVVEPDYPTVEENHWLNDYAEETGLTDDESLFDSDEDDEEEESDTVHPLSQTSPTKKVDRKIWNPFFD